MSCQKGCFEASVQCCNDIVIRAGFPPNLSLFWILSVAGSNQRYQRQVLTAGNGDLTISKDDLPDGFLTTGKQLKIEVRSGANYLQPVIFVFDAIEYTCIIASLVGFDVEESDDSPINLIQSTDAEIPAGPGANYLIPLVSADFIHNGSPHATQADNAAFVGKSLAVFWNNLGRYLTEAEFEVTATGINILVPAFDATANTYSFYVYIIGSL